MAMVFTICQLAAGPRLAPSEGRTRNVAEAASNVPSGRVPTTTASSGVVVPTAEPGAGAASRTGGGDVSTTNVTGADSADRLPASSTVTTVKLVVTSSVNVSGGKAKPHVPPENVTGATTGRLPSPMASSPWRRKRAIMPSGTCAAVVPAGRRPVTTTWIPPTSGSASCAAPTSPRASSDPATGGGVTRNDRVAIAPGLPFGSTVATPSTYSPGLSATPPVAGYRNGACPVDGPAVIVLGNPSSGSPSRASDRVTALPGSVAPITGTGNVIPDAARRALSGGYDSVVTGATVSTMNDATASGATLGTGNATSRARAVRVTAPCGRVTPTCHVPEAALTGTPVARGVGAPPPTCTNRSTLPPTLSVIVVPRRT